MPNRICWRGGVGGGGSEEAVGANQSHPAPSGLCHQVLPGRFCTRPPCPWYPCPLQPCGQCLAGTAGSPAPALLSAACRSRPGELDTQTACIAPHTAENCWPDSSGTECTRTSSGFMIATKQLTWQSMGSACCIIPLLQWQCWYCMCLVHCINICVWQWQGYRYGCNHMMSISLMHMLAAMVFFP